jgi:hypothetical protein
MREYFISYPDEVLVMRLSADKPASVSFTLAPEISYIPGLREQDKRTGSVVAEGNRIVLPGSLLRGRLAEEADRGNLGAAD